MLFSKTNLIISALMLLTQNLWPQEWTQWRGSNRDGHIKTFAVPTIWPDSLKKIWRVEAGAGLSSPVVAYGKIYLLTRNGDDEVVSCYQLKDGSRLWQQRYAAHFIPNPQAIRPDLFPASRGKGPFATPVIHNGHLYTLGVDRVLSCFEAKTGALKWRQYYMKQNIPDKVIYECPPCSCGEDGKEFSEPGQCSACRMTLGAKGMETSASFGGAGNYYGTSASPVVAGKIGVVNIGNLDGGSLIAFDLKTGEEKWRSQCPPPSSSSPIIAELHGIQQAVVLTRENLAGIDLVNGRQLWSYAIESNAQIVTPLVFEDLVIFSAYRSPTTAIRLKKAGDVWSTEKAWSTNEITLYTSTPVLVGDKLFGLSYANRGQFFGMDARTGKTLWTSDGRQAEGAAILSAGEILLALTNEAKLMIMKESENRYEPITHYTVANSPTWAHPVIWEKNILIKDESSVALWRMD